MAVPLPEPAATTGNAFHAAESVKFSGVPAHNT
jgi:hypothetical protein